MTAIGKLLVALFTVVVLIGALCFSGLLFVIWPTTLGDQQLTISGATVEKLRQLQGEEKFREDMTHFYPGAPDEVSRLSAQEGVNSVVEALVRELPRNPRRSVVLREFKRALPAYDRFDSEERDQVLLYFERIMVITGVKDSGELLNVWRYGVPYGWFVEA